MTFDSPLTSQGTKFSFKSKVPFLDKSLNIAVLEVSNRDSSELPDPVILSRKDLEAVGIDDLAVIGYGHQRSQSKHLDIKCAVVKPDSNRAVQVSTKPLPMLCDNS